MGGFAKRSLKQLLAQGMTMGRTSQLSSSTASSRQLLQLRNVKFNQVRESTTESLNSIENALQMLTRHLAFVRSTPQMFVLLMVAYIIYRGGDDRTTVHDMQGGYLTKAQYQGILDMENALYSAGDVFTQNTPLTFENAIRATKCHPVLKIGNPFRKDPFTKDLEAWWTRKHGHRPAHLLLATIVIALALRSKQLIAFLLEDAKYYMDGVGSLVRLYSFAVEHGTLLGDKGTVHANTTRLGTLVDTLLVPYWQNTENEPIRALAKAHTSKEAVRILRESMPHFGDLNAIHTVEYLQVIDKTTQRLKFTNSSLQADMCVLGTNAESMLNLFKGRKLADDEQAAAMTLFTTQVQEAMPKLITYQTSDGKLHTMKWRQQVNAMVVQSNSCKVVQVLQTFLTGQSGQHKRATCPLKWKKIRVPTKKRKLTKK